MSAEPASGGPAGQVVTEIPPSGEGATPLTVISAGREVELGTRSMLLLAEGLFRFDVVPHEDSIKTILRNLSTEPVAHVRYGPVGGGATVLGDGGELAVSSTSRFGGEVIQVRADGSERAVAKLLVGSVCHLDRGVTSFTAQATLL